MSWFRRNKNPAGSQEYLRTSDNVNRPLAAFLTLLLIFAAAAIIFGLFMGGRWLANNLDGSDQPPSTVATTPVTEVTPESSSTTAGSGSTGSAGTSTTGSNNASQSGSTATSTSNSSSTTSATSSSSGSNATSSSASNTQSAATTPTTGAQSETAAAIPATGPVETLVLFVSATIAAMAGYQVWLRRSHSL